MRIDAHQHFWNYTANAADYGWISDRSAVLRRDFEPPQLEPLLREIGFEGTIAVQARERREETDYLLALAGQYPLIKGVVGWLDLTDPDVEADLERYSPNVRLRGLRMVIHDRVDVNFADSPAHRRGVGLLKRHGLTYDLLVRPQHLPSALQLVDACPEQAFVIDHLAKPLIATGEMSPWRDYIRELARRPRVHCKLSGMVTEASETTWTPADLRPYLDVVLEAFGPERLMIGSDWPVCTRVADYGRTMGVVIDWTKALAPAERDAILGGTCARFYGVR
jgi:L-fuconolactonase